jgi:hypothetical protein
VTFPPGDAHRFWNAGADELVCAGVIRPPDNVEYFLGEIFASTQRRGGKRPAPEPIQRSRRANAADAAAPTSAR